MAEVFKGRSSGAAGFEKIVAIKRILPHLSDDQDFISMFIDEAKLSANLNHSNIGQVFEFGKIENCYFIAMEYIHGKDLRAIQQSFQAQNQRMPLAMAIRIVLDVCNALEYAHNKRGPDNRNLEIVHRDVSPQNILTSFEGAVKLIDFGIAKALSRSTKTADGNLKGKFGYMSPEQVDGAAVDSRSDIFALGTVMFEVLTGTRLFQGESELATLEKVRQAQIPVLSAMVPDLPHPLEAILGRALARRPEDRFQRAEEMHEALERFCQETRQVYSTKQLSHWMKSNFREALPGAGAAAEADPNALFQTRPDPPVGSQTLPDPLPMKVPPPDGQERKSRETEDRVAALRASLLGTSPPPEPKADVSRKGKSTQPFGSMPGSQPPPVDPAAQQAAQQDADLIAQLQPVDTSAEAATVMMDDDQPMAPPPQAPAMSPGTPAQSPPLTLPETQEPSAQSYEQSHTMVAPEALEELIHAGAVSPPETEAPETLPGMGEDLDLMEPLDDGPTMVDADPRALLEQLGIASADGNQEAAATADVATSPTAKTQMDMGPAMAAATSPTAKTQMDMGFSPIAPDQTDEEDLLSYAEEGADETDDDDDQEATVLFSSNQENQTSPPPQEIPVQLAPPQQAVTPAAPSLAQQEELEKGPTSPAPAISHVAGPGSGRMEAAPADQPKKGWLLPMILFFGVFLLAIGGAVAYYLVVHQKPDAKGVAKAAKAAVAATAAAKVGAVVITSDKALSGDLLLDGKKKASLSNAARYSLEAVAVGKHSLEVQDAHRVFKKEITVQGGKTVTVKVEMPEAKPLQQDSEAAQPKAAPKAQPKAQPKLKAEPKLKPEPKAAPKTQPKPKAEPKPKAQPKPKTQPKPKAQPKPKPRPKPKAQPKPKPRPRPKPKAQPKARPKPKGKPGFLIVVSRPPSKIFVDGKDVGRKTPVPPSNPLSLSAGRHKITLEVGGKRHDFKVTVKAGQTGKLIKTLK